MIDSSDYINRRSNIHIKDKDDQQKHLMITSEERKKLMTRYQFQTLIAVSKNQV